jgi:hypothetical protein
MLPASSRTTRRAGRTFLSCIPNGAGFLPSVNDGSHRGPSLILGELSLADLTAAPVTAGDPLAVTVPSSYGYVLVSPA